MANARTHTIPAIAAFVAIAAVMAIAAIAPRPALADDGTPIPDATATLTPQGQELQALVNAGALADLHWPNFSDYHGQVTMFYAPGYALAWSDGGKPTPQALAVIEALKHADLKGLDPEDYDASRWDARLAKLAPKDPDAIRRSRSRVVVFSPAMTDANQAIKDFLHSRMYRHWRVNRMSAKARRLTEEVYRILHADPSLLPDDWRARAGEGGTHRAAIVVGDYVAGMTDRYAMDEHRRLTDIAVNG